MTKYGGLLGVIAHSNPSHIMKHLVVNVKISEAIIYEVDFRIFNS